MTSIRTKISLALALLAPAVAFGQVPLRATLGFSARIADQGRPVTGDHAFVFTFFDTAAAGTGTSQWAETQTLTVNDGVVTASLGADGVTPNLFPLWLFSGADRWLEVSMDGVTFGPRMAVQAVPFAMHAIAADNVWSTTASNWASGATFGAAGASTYTYPVAIYLPLNATCTWTATQRIFFGTGYALTTGNQMNAAWKIGASGADSRYTTYSSMYGNSLPGWSFADATFTYSGQFSALSTVYFGCAHTATLDSAAKVNNCFTSATCVAR